MSDTANPESGAERLGPDGPPPNAEDQAAARISAVLNDPGHPEAEPTQEAEEPRGEPQADEEQPAEAEEEAPEEQPSEDESEAEPEGDGEELSEFSLPELAEALEMEPDALGDSLKVTVKVDGEEKTVTLNEAIRGHQFEADYRQKTARLADEKRTFESERQQHTERLTQNLHYSAQLAQALEQRILGDEKGLERLIDPNSPDYNPDEFHRKQWAIQQNKGLLDQAKQAINGQAQQSQQEMEKARQEYRAEQQRRLADKLPVLADPVQGAQKTGEYAAFLENQGYTREEVEGFFNGPFDHRQIVILDMAQKYAAMDRGKGVKKRLKNLPPVTKPGQGKSRPSAEERTESVRDRLRKAGTRGTRKSQKQAATDYVRHLLD